MKNIGYFVWYRKVVIHRKEGKNREIIYIVQNAGNSQPHKCNKRKMILSNVV